MSTPALRTARKIALRVLLGVVVVGDIALMVWLAGWPGVALVLLPILVLFGPTAVAVRTGRGSLGKRADGTRGWVAWLLFAPYLMTSRLSFDLVLVFSRGKPFAVVAPNLAFGRRLTDAEAKRIDFVSVLDVAAEFAEVRAFRRRPGYCSLPVFDITAPTPAQLRIAVDWLRGAVARGPVYVHCALGHGRSACVVLAYLLATGVVTTVAEGMKLLRERRPKVKLTRSQREAAGAFELTSPRL